MYYIYIYSKIDINDKYNSIIVYNIIVYSRA